jgi:hypothetical protein
MPITNQMKNYLRIPLPLAAGLAVNSDNHTMNKKKIIKDTLEIGHLKQMICIKIKRIMKLQRKYAKN